VGIFDLVKQHKEGILSFFRSSGKEIIDLCIPESCRLGNDALVPAGLGQLVETLAGQETDRRMVVFSQAEHCLHCALCRAFEQKEFLDGPSGAIGFDDSIAAFDPVFIRLCLTGKKPGIHIRSSAVLVPVCTIFPAVFPTVFPAK
jgi:hypothetical protein